MTVTKLIFMKIMFTQQLFAKNSHNELHENLMNGSITTSMSHINRQQMNMVSTNGTYNF
jgi:hypothetical protein